MQLCPKARRNALQGNVERVKVAPDGVPLSSVVVMTMKGSA